MLVFGVQHHGVCTETRVGALRVHTHPPDTDELIQALINICSRKDESTETGGWEEENNGGEDERV